MSKIRGFHLMRSVCRIILQKTVKEEESVNLSEKRWLSPLSTQTYFLSDHPREDGVSTPMKAEVNFLMLPEGIG